MGWFSSDPPKPSREEKALWQAQSALAEQQRQMVDQQAQQNKLLIPFFAKQEGFDVQIDPTTGQITGISQIETPEMARDKEIRSLMQERSLKALKGELPVDPALERSLEQQEAELRNRMKQQLGPGYESSSAGIETMGEFYRSAEGLREGARTGQLTLAEQLGLTREQMEMHRRGTAQDVFRQFGVADPMSFAGALGQVQQSYAQAAAPLAQQRNMQFQADMANAANMSQMVGAGLGAAGSIVGGGVVPGIPKVSK